MAHDVFISYSTKDKPTADAVCATLERRGIRCWIAPRDILPGMDWGEAIIDAIEQSRVMILVFSRNANASPQIKREVERAVSKGLTVVPLRIEDVPMSKSLEYFVSTPHWLDALNPPLERHLAQLADTLRVLLDRSRAGATADSGYARTPPARPPPMPVSPPPMPAMKPAAAPVRTPEVPSAVGAGLPARGQTAEGEEEAHPEVKVKVVSEGAADASTHPAGDKSQPTESAAGTTTEDASAPAKPAESKSARATEAASTPTTASTITAASISAASAPGTRPPAVPTAAPKPPPPMPGRLPGLGPPPGSGSGPGPGPFPFLIKLFGPISPGAQIAIAVGGLLVLLMLLGCVLSAFVGALSSGTRHY